VETGQPRKCVRCSYDQRAVATEDRERGLPPRVRTMLLVDGQWCHAFGHWSVWWGGGFIRGGHGPAAEQYWVCKHCRAPTEAVQKTEKGYDL
jgi:hypothetical protein